MGEEEEERWPASWEQRGRFPAWVNNTLRKWVGEAAADADAPHGCDGLQGQGRELDGGYGARDSGGGGLQHPGQNDGSGGGDKDDGTDDAQRPFRNAANGDGETRGETLSRSSALAVMHEEEQEPPWWRRLDGNDEGATGDGSGDEDEKMVALGHGHGIFEVHNPVANPIPEQGFPRNVDVDVALGFPHRPSPLASSTHEDGPNTGSEFSGHSDISEKADGVVPVPKGSSSQIPIRQAAGNNGKLAVSTRGGEQSSSSRSTADIHPPPPSQYEELALSLQRQVLDGGENTRPEELIHHEEKVSGQYLPARAAASSSAPPDIARRQLLPHPDEAHVKDTLGFLPGAKSTSAFASAMRPRHQIGQKQLGPLGAAGQSVPVPVPVRLAGADAVSTPESHAPWLDQAWYAWFREERRRGGGAKQ